MPLYILLPGIIGLFIFTIAFFKWPKYAIAGLIIVKPIIDLAWDRFIILDINFLKLYAGLFVLLGVITVLKNRYDLFNHKISILWICFLLLNFVSIFVISNAVITTKLKYFLAIANGFIIFTLCRYLFDWEKDKHFFISMFILAGVVPILIWLIPIMLGNPILSNDPLQRIQGPYLNFWQFNFIGLQTIIFCLSFLSIHNSKSEIRSNKQRSVSPFPHFSVSWIRIIVFILLVISILMVYKSYSRAGWVTLFVVLSLWSIFMHKYIITLIVPLVAVIILFVPPFSRDSQKVIISEVDQDFKASTIESQPFRGRLSYWNKALKHFGRQSIMKKIFGSGITTFKIENDYIRVLVENGLIGLAVYIVLLFSSLVFIGIQFFHTRNPIFLTFGITLVVLALMSIGAHPSLMPNFHWFTWGSVGFAFSNARSLTKP